MNKVYVVQEPLMRSPSTGDIIRKMDLTPAKEFGELIFLLDWSIFKNGINSEEIYWIVRKQFEETEYISENDFILLIGHPIAMAITFRVATEKGNKVQMLDWDRHNSEYNVVVFDREEL